MAKWRRGLVLAVADGVPARALVMALVIGTILNLINQGDVALLHGTSLNWLKFALTYWRLTRQHPRRGGGAAARRTLMPVFYNRIAGQKLHRLEALSDGVFAVAMTLSGARSSRAPMAAAIHSERELWHALMALSPAPRHLSDELHDALGIFWIGQQTQHDLLASDRSYAWISLAFLMAVTLVPFSTACWPNSSAYRLALLVYWANLLVLGAFGRRHAISCAAFRVAQGGCRAAFLVAIRAARSDSPGALRLRRGAVRVLDLVEHRIDRHGAADLRHRPALQAVFVDVED